ncbi:MAG TPA: hypothetical protein VFD45_02235 [Patescibacteria group bacterium]|nr:hypothetical protein [Patescibacteria group bacterium]
MEIVYVDNKCLKIRSKKTSFVVDPNSSMTKTSADFILLLKDEKYNLQKISDYRLIISGSGEYELGGIKVSGVRTGADFVYSIRIDNTELIIGKADAISKMPDKAREHELAILNTDTVLSESIITIIEPRMVVLYGDKIEESIKALGKDLAMVQKTKKLSIKEGKLPEEMEVVVLE